jgi:hypothetical protein
MTIRLLTLYLRSRRIGRVVAVVVGSALAWAVLLPWASGVGPFALLLRLVIAIAAATGIAGGLAGPFGETEVSAGTRFPALRAGQIAGTALLAGVGFAAAAAIRHTSVVVTVRDLAGVVGLALLTGAAVGALWSWSLPVGYALLCAGEVDLNQQPFWAWPLQPAADSFALALAAVVLVAGVVLATCLAVLRGGGPPPEKFHEIRDNLRFR